MSTVDLRELNASEFVLHFGGRTNEIDAFTFSNALIGLGEAIQEINRQTRPEMAVEVIIDGVGPGSFRARIKTIPKTLSGLFKGEGLAGQILAGILSTMIYEKVFHQPDSIITVGPDSVVIEKGRDRIIIPRNVWDAKERIPDPQKVDRYISRAFSSIEEDSSISDFGIIPNISSPGGDFLIPRESFMLLTAPDTRADDAAAGGKYVDQRASLTVLKAVFQRGNRKWEFVWSGLKIAAAISDNTFFDRLASRQVWLAQGDTLEVVLRIHQRYDDMNRIYINERYEIVDVVEVIHREKQEDLLGR